MNIAFVLLTYAADAPAGVERTIAALAEGLRRLGHRATILTAAADKRADPEVIRLRSVRLPCPAREDHLEAALADPAPVMDEVRSMLTDQRIDVVCWADASWGLGHLAPAPPGVRTVLNVAVLRTDPLFHQALAREPDVVITNSPFLREEASAAGIDASQWVPVPNALLVAADPPGWTRREQLRRSGPIRIVARAEPHKGVHELIAALPPGVERRVEIVLAAAGFEYWAGMQDAVLAECAEAARQAPGQVEVLPTLPWRQVPKFLGGAALTIISTTSPETWCNVAAEALSAGTPVIAYDFGHVPTLTGPAGLMVPPQEPAIALWEAALDILGDEDAYHRAARLAPTRVADHTPAASASRFLTAVTAPPRREDPK